MTSTPSRRRSSGTGCCNLDDDGEPRVEYQRPYDTLCDPEVQANALNWAAEAKAKGEVQTQTRAVTLVEGLNLARSG